METGGCSLWGSLSVSLFLRTMKQVIKAISERKDCIFHWWLLVSMFKSSTKPLTGEVIKQANLVKRSQNKKRFSLVNYKSRWFVLTTDFLAYYEGECEVRSKDNKNNKICHSTPWTFWTESQRQRKGPCRSVDCESCRNRRSRTHHRYGIGAQWFEKFFGSADSVQPVRV